MIRTTTTIAILTTAAALTLSGCGAWGGKVISSADLAGTVSTQELDFADFDAVDLSGSGDVNVTLGAEFSVTVTTDDALFAHLEHSLDGNTLRLAQPFTVAGASPQLSYEVTMPVVSALEVSGSGTITAFELDEESLTLSVTGSGDVTVSGRATSVYAELTGSGKVNFSNVLARDAVAELTGSGEIWVAVFGSLEAKITGSGAIRATGSPHTARVDVTGSGDFLGEDLAAADAVVDISGSGDVTIGVANTLRASISGSGDVTYLGDPQVTTDIAGSGSVKAG